MQQPALDAAGIAARYVRLMAGTEPGAFEALLAELTKAAQVLSDLGCGDVHAAAQRVGRNTDDALVMQVIQIAVIAGETVNHSIRDLLLFHNSVNRPLLEFRRVSAKLLTVSVSEHLQKALYLI